MENSFLVKLGINVEEVAAGIHKSNALIEEFTGQLEGLATGFAEIFAVREIVNFTKEVSELASKANGVRQAFEQIPFSTNLLHEMNEATHETVSNLELMKEAIKAQNLQIPMEKLGTIMSFVHDRALATGQSFEELSEKVLTGIGAKSPKAFRDLQISSEELSKSIKENGSFLDGFLAIADKHLKDAPIIMDETGKAVEQNAKKWEDLKVKIGDAVNQSGVLAKSIGFINDEMDVLTSDSVSGWEKYFNLLIPGLNLGTLLTKEQKGEQEKLNKEKEKEADIQRLINVYNKNKNIDLEAYIKAYDVQITKAQLLQRIAESKTKENKTEIFDLGTIEGIEAKITDIKEKQRTAHGAIIHGYEQEIQKLQERERLLKEGEKGPSKQHDVGKTIAETKTLAGELDKAAQAAYNATHQADTMEKTFEKLNKTLSNLAGGKGLVPVVGGFQKATESMKEQAEQAKKSGEANDRFAISIGSSLGPALAGVQTFAQGLSQAAIQIVNKMEEIALANIIAKATESGSNPVAAVALASAGFAAVKSLFAKIGGSVSGGGASGLSGNGGSNLNRSGYNLQPQAIQITGTVQGRDIVFAYDKNKQLDLQRK